MRLLEGRFSGFGLLDPPPQGRGLGPRTVKFFLFILTGFANRWDDWVLAAEEHDPSGLRYVNSSCGTCPPHPPEVTDWFVFVFFGPAHGVQVGLLAAAESSPPVLFWTIFLC